MKALFSIKPCWNKKRVLATLVCVAFFAIIQKATGGWSGDDTGPLYSAPLTSGPKAEPPSSVNEEDIFDSLSLFLAKPQVESPSSVNEEDIFDSLSLFLAKPQVEPPSSVNERDITNNFSTSNTEEFLLPLLDQDIKDLFITNRNKLLTWFSEDIIGNIRSCGIVPFEHHLMEGELSDYWAQELIGADLIKKELEQIPPPEKPLLIAVFDTLTTLGGEHGHYVKNLISHQNRHAILPDLGTKIRLFDIPSEKQKQANHLRQTSTNTGKLSDNYYIVSSELRGQQAIPSFINSSMKWLTGIFNLWSIFRPTRDLPDISMYEAFQTLSPPAVIVTSSDNDFMVALNLVKSEASRDFHVIIVGSFSPSGFVSAFSQEGDEVHILAPSDSYITSADGAGEYKQFGGTSGATPLVTGALAGFEWAGGYHPDGLESKILLEKTAILTLHSHENPRQNGVGLVNAYKLGMTALRLREKCQNQDPFCFKREIRNDDNYQFPQDESLPEELALMFPECALKNTPTLQSETPSLIVRTQQHSSLTLQEEMLSYNICANKQALFDRLRQAVLLSPERRDLWESLSCIYKQAGFEQNSLMIDRIALAQASPQERLNKLLPLLQEQPKANRRIAPWVLTELINQDRREELELMIQSENLDLREVLATATNSLSHKEGLDILHKFTTIDGLDNMTATSVALSAGRIGGSGGADILLRLVNFDSFLVRETVVESAGTIGGFEGARVLLQMTNDITDIKETVIEIAAQIGGAEGAEVLRQMTDDEDDKIRELVAYGAGAIGGHEGGLLLSRYLMMDHSASVRAAVADTARELDTASALEILHQTAEDRAWEVRDRTAGSLAKIGTAQGLDLLEQLFANEQDSRVKINSSSAVGYYHNNKYDEYDQRIRILQSLARDEDPEVRIEAMKGAYDIGFHPSALQMIRYMTRDTHFEVRAEALDLLKKIQF